MADSTFDMQLRLMGGFEEDLKKLSASSKGAGDTMAASFAGASKQLTQISGGIRGLLRVVKGFGAGLAAALGVGFTMDALIGHISKLREEAKKTDESLRQLGMRTAMLGQDWVEASESARAFAEVQSKVFTTAKSEIVAMLNLGQAYGLAADHAEDLARQSLQVSRAFGSDALATMQMLVDATNDEASAFQRLGKTIGLQIPDWKTFTDLLFNLQTVDLANQLERLMADSSSSRSEKDRLLAEITKRGPIKPLSAFTAEKPKWLIEESAETMGRENLIRGEQRRIVSEQRSDFGAGFKKGLDQVHDALTDFSAAGEEAVMRVSGSMVMEFEDAFAAIITGTKSAKDAFKDMAKAVLAEIARIVAKLVAMQIVTSIFGPNTGLSTAARAGGGMWGPGHSSPNGGSYSKFMLAYRNAPVRMADGGMAYKPTLGVFGEDGPEAFVKTRRGAIPVTLSGGGGRGTTNVNFTIRSLDGDRAGQAILRERQMIVAMVRDAIERNKGNLRTSVGRV